MNLILNMLVNATVVWVIALAVVIGLVELLGLYVLAVTGPLRWIFYRIWPDREPKRDPIYGVFPIADTAAGEDVLAELTRTD